MAFSPDGTLILASTTERQVRLFDVASGRPVGRPLATTGGVDRVAFGPDNRWLVWAGGDRNGNGDLRLVDQSHVWRDVCLRIGRNLTSREWEQYLGSEPRQVTCPYALIVDLDPASSEQAGEAMEIVRRAVAAAQQIDDADINRDLPRSRCRPANTPSPSSRATGISATVVDSPGR